MGQFVCFAHSGRIALAGLNVTTKCCWVAQSAAKKNRRDEHTRTRMLYTFYSDLYVFATTIAVSAVVFFFFLFPIGSEEFEQIYLSEFVTNSLLASQLKLFAPDWLWRLFFRHFPE